MDDQNQWHDYDPSDLSTHPEEGTNIQIEFADGWQYPAIYSRAEGGYSTTGQVPPPERTVLKWRWRYQP
jgi:hypothetical protein